MILSPVSYKTYTLYEAGDSFLSQFSNFLKCFSYFCTDQKINKIMYPLKFKPILKSTLWGGERIIPFKQLDCQQEQVGESWEISDVPGDESVVAEGADAGKNLTQLMEEIRFVNFIFSFCSSPVYIVIHIYVNIIVF